MEAGVVGVADSEEEAWRPKLSSSSFLAAASEAVSQREEEGERERGRAASTATTTSTTTTCCFNPCSAVAVEEGRRERGRLEAGHLLLTTMVAGYKGRRRKRR